MSTYLYIASTSRLVLAICSLTAEVHFPSHLSLETEAFNIYLFFKFRGPASLPLSIGDHRYIDGERELPRVGWPLRPRRTERRSGRQQHRR